MLDVRGVFYFVNCQPHLDKSRKSKERPTDSKPLSSLNERSEWSLYFERSGLLSNNYNLGGYSAEVPPLPIPNRVVKLSIADGTALRCGRVGSRHFQSPEDSSPGLFVFIQSVNVLLLRFALFFSLVPFHSTKISGKEKID